MKAIIYTEYGSPDVLKLKEINKPVPKPDEALIKVRAVSLNASDVEFLTGSPLYTRAWGLRKPKFQILGSDIAGTVESTGKAVTRFKAGDAVFGDVLGRWGGFAEYVCVPEKDLTLKPDELSFEQAAALPQAALVALQGLTNKPGIKSGQSVLINGAGGGSGTFAIQIAKMYGASVTGVDNGLKLELMHSLGADTVLDYTKTDFTKNGVKYDLILDFVASHSIFDYKRALKPDGRYLMVGGSVGHILSTLILGSLLSLFGSKKLRILGAKPNKDMEVMIDLIKSGKVKPIIDKTFPLDQAPETLRYLSEGRALGKVLIKLD